MPAGRQNRDDSQLVGWQSPYCMACTFGMLVAGAVTVVKTGKKTATGWLSITILAGQQLRFTTDDLTRKS
ncbi:hypothetical protein T10_6346 [Trichinella papuae]|uniref:Uncharacterized protein n=1 Tax=Trichinella papuae TaxID=268474 RepID=A0A0V1MRZ2_9BILA|nr:hypothetical protein T10_6346 [Trichinella papuae]